MDVINELKLYIASYVKLEEDIAIKNKTIRDIRNKKNKIEGCILKLIEDNNLKNTKINLNNCYIKYNINETLCPVNMQFIKDCLKKYFKNNDHSERLIKFIPLSRPNHRLDN